MVRRNLVTFPNQKATHFLFDAGKSSYLEVFETAMPVHM